MDSIDKEYAIEGWGFLIVEEEEESDSKF